MACVVRRATVPIITITMRPGMSMWSLIMTVTGRDADVHPSTSASSTIPYCALLSYTEDGAVSFFCTETPGLTLYAAYETGASLSSSQSTQVLQSSSSVVVRSTSIGISTSTNTAISSMMLSSSTNSITPAPVPFTQSQQTAGTTTQVPLTTTSTSNAAGMLVLSKNTKSSMVWAVAVILISF